MTPEEYRLRRWLDRHRVLVNVAAFAVAILAGLALSLAIGLITGDFKP